MVLLPWPKKVQEQGGNYHLNFKAMIVMDSSCPEGVDVYAQMLQEEISSSTGIKIKRTRGLAKKGDIRLFVDESCFKSRYYLDVNEDGITIRGGWTASLGQGVQTLRQLFRQYAGLLPAVKIEDEPDFKTRGFFHDVTRGRVQTLSNLKKMVDTMAFYKLNQLQLYIEHTYLFRDMTELWRDETPLEAQEIMELDAYCAERGIELVPCLASFGHLYKLLGTRSYAALCELEGSAGQEFSFWDQMAHHTLNPLDLRSMELIKGMIGEFMQLFSSDKFNICADETFDLGTGKSREEAGERGRGVLYAEFVSGLFDYLVENGKTPMFWGDIICESPALIKEFPGETICLAWGYSEQEKDTQVRVLSEAGAKLYVCPGTRGWNHFVNQMYESYENIARMCDYGRKYHALGVLNTDWGDYGHVGHPDFSIPCMIYGAAFSWGKNVAEFDEMNRMISLLEYGDASGEFVGYLAKISTLEVFGWANAVQYKEWTQKGRETEGILKDFGAESEQRFAMADKQAAELSVQLSAVCRSMSGEKRRIAACAQLSLRMVVLWNRVLMYLLGKMPAGMLAGELEECLYHYKAYWRENSREGDLARVSDVFFWYADLLRDGSGE